MSISILALISAGAVTDDDNILTLIQGLDLQAAQGVANWLSLTTKGPVKLQFMDMEHGVTFISQTYEETLAKIKYVDANLPGASN